MNKILFIIALICSFTLSVIFVAIILKLAKKHAWFDQTNERKIHDGLIPRLGGIGFSLSFLIISLLSVFLFPALNTSLRFHRDVLMVFGAVFLIILAGVVDDFKPIRPRYKIIIQFVAAAIVLYADITFHTIKLPFIPLSVDLGIFRYPLTLLWIIGITNAVNLIDGIDGLAGGVSFIVSLSLTIIFISWRNYGAIFLSAIMTASIAGFLLFNLPLPKAKIFMGDCGSQFLGFMLAVLPLLNNGYGQASLSLPFAAALLLIPIFDTFAAMWRRIRDGKKIGSPDRQHMHHKLLNLGLSVVQIDAIIWSIQIAISALVLLSFRTDNLASFFLFATPYAIIIIFFTLLHINNRKHMKQASSN